MKRTILSLLVAGLFAGIGTSAIAQDAAAQPAAQEQAKAVTGTDSNSQQPAKSAEQADPAIEAVAATQSGSNPEYNAAKNKAQTEYIDAKVKCDNLQGDAKLSCVTEARTARTSALAQAKTQWDGPAKTSATVDAKPVKEMESDSSVQPKKTKDY
jgi:hypothetical protein